MVIDRELQRGLHRNGTIDIFSRLKGCTGMSPKVNPKLSDASPDSEQSTNETVGSAGERICDELKSIQEYVADLLIRVGGKGKSASPVAAADAPLESKIDESTTDMQEASQCESGVRHGYVLPTQLRDLAPRSKPPDARYLDAMRQLANSHAQVAVDSHARSCLRRRALNNALAGIVCLAGTVICLATFTALGPAIAVGQTAGIVGTVYFLCVASVATRRWLACPSVSANEAAYLVQRSPLKEIP